MNTDGMATRYQPADIENKWYDRWEKGNYFAPSGSGKPYAIMIPPPNVTGTLHMGHAFQDTIMDALIRYHRMLGDNTLWQPGSDHAGIATQMVVERQLNAQGKTRHDLGREAFTAKVWEWKAESGGQIMRQLRRLGASLDWMRERFTMDDALSRAVRTLFVKLYDDGLIYRGKRLVNWDPVLKTAISDLEVENREENGHMYHVRYPFVAGQGLDGQYMHIATTRPETILADGALAVHPDDERYRHLLGKMVHVPLTERVIPIIADEYVEMDFGTGCVKITPAHDFNDYAVGQRHTMEVINLMNPDATLNDNVPAAYRGLDRWVAREKIVADLDAAGLLEKVEPHTLKRPYGDRSGVVIEPYLTDQWFVDLSSDKGMAKLTQPALDAVRDGRIKFVPDNWKNTYYNWMENLQDWCISRQLWWGHRIPAWYDADGNVYVAENEAAVREKYRLAAEHPLTQDEDVLDTWFSSALWPFATQGWPDDTADLKTYYPGNVLVTGFDIIFFWVARMVLMGMYCMNGAVPFREVYIHGLVRDSEGQKMSKSKGNVLDPLDIIDGIDGEALVAKRTSGMMQPQKAEKIAAQTRKEYPDGIAAYGTDALRFTFAAQATMGRDIVFDTKRVEGYRNFCNKLWNAARFVQMQTAGQSITAAPVKEKSAADRWIYGALDRTIRSVREAFDTYRFDFAAQALYDFIWNQYCDWYLELAKPVLGKHNDDDAEKARTRHTLLDVLEQALRLIHPLMPYISEEIWQQTAPLLGTAGDTLMTQAYPTASNGEDPQADAEIAWLQETLLGVRKIRADMNIAPGKPLPLIISGLDDNARGYLAAQERSLLALGRLDSVRVLADGEAEPEAAAFMVGSAKNMIPLAGLIDKTAELARLDKEIAKREQNIARLSGQLANVRFTASAPAALVEQTRAQLASDEETVAALRAQREKVAAL
ncbi:valine--tRNA ligase [Cardiobacterium valvarum]|uniref:Valine--tRNA ligase n=1 Tax=Cardiobacterium valvarum TaxID=194702 RepID=A0A381EFI1_9GAMM|nr:valine--tRNA ligase [Cardiobacterium valvarum]SUX25517.1 Valine--tRNA ligase [Cardiobacterium valvarum]